MLAGFDTDPSRGSKDQHEERERREPKDPETVAIATWRRPERQHQRWYPEAEHDLSKTR